MTRALAAILLLPGAAAGDTLLHEDFGSDPIGTRAVPAGDPGRFSYSDGAVEMDIDIGAGYSRLAWPLARPLTESDTFTVTMRFRLDRIDFDPFGNFCQISFGLLNQSNTGPVRTASPADAWELLTIDYFPGAFPSYTPTFIRQDPGDGSDPLNDTFLKFPAGPASFIADPGEIGSLPERTELTTELHYDAGTRHITISLADGEGGLTINNAIANPDGIGSTIELQLDGEYPFVFDAFALVNWYHPEGGTGALTASSIRVEAASGAPSDLLAAAFPDGPPSPVLRDGQLTLTYTRDLTRRGFTVAAQASADGASWSPVGHTVLSAGPAYEVRQVSIAGDLPRALLRLVVAPE